MKTLTSEPIARMATGVLLSAAAWLAMGCNSTATSPSVTTPAPVSAAPAQGQPLFATDQEAAAAMLTAVKANDHDQVHLLLGPAWKELVSGDNVEDTNAFKEFALRAAEKEHLEKENDATSILYVGKEEWPFPIPLTKTPQGKWFFDTEAGKTEILTRRIGENELDAIEVCQNYVRAQQEYARKDRDGSGVLKFAQRIISKPGMMDGLYWTPASGQEPSPLGHLFAVAATQGYEHTTGHPHEPYHGFHFRVLKRQGSEAQGGKHDYVINGNMVAGFALVAFPEKYESSGIMTFVVNQQGKVFEKDMGPNTTDLARKMTEYNPDSTWKPVKG